MCAEYYIVISWLCLQTDRYHADAVDNDIHPLDQEPHVLAEHAEGILQQILVRHTYCHKFDLLCSEILYTVSLALPVLNGNSKYFHLYQLCGDIDTCLVSKWLFLERVYCKNNCDVCRMWLKMPGCLKSYQRKLKMS